MPKPLQNQIRQALLGLAGETVRRDRVRGKKVKTIKGVADAFHRLRVGAYRIMYDFIPKDQTMLVLGIVDRADLEEWLRNR